MNEQELRKLYEKIVKDCLEIAVRRGHEYNSDGNMIGSYSEYGVDDICSIIKVKAIRIKNNPAISKRELPDIINYCCELLRRIK